MAENEIYRLDIVVGVSGDESSERRLRAFDRFVEQTARRTSLLDRLTGPARRVEEQFNRTRQAAQTLDRQRIEPSISLRDRVTSGVRQVESRLSNLANRAYTVTIGARDMTAGVAQSIKKAVTSPLSLVGMGTTGLGAGYIVGSSVSKAMDFEAQMSSIKALTGLAGEEMAKMSSLAIEMGATTKYSALEAAQGIEELLKAGISPTTVATGGLEAALSLATAGSLGLADAAEIMSTAMNAYRSDGMTAAQAADILAGTANASATSVEELRYSLSMVSAVASGIGQSFKDTNTALGLFANNGLKGSDAGTSLKTMMSNLQPSTDKQIELFKRLGIVTANGSNKFFTASGKLKSLAEISDVLTKSLSKMTDQQRMAALDTMFGSDAIRAANILYKEGSDGVKKFAQEMSKVTALQVAKEKMENASGAVEQFKGAMETLQIAALTPFMPIIKRVALGIAEFTDKIGPGITSKMENASKAIEGFVDRLSLNEKFQKMGWGEKVVYALEQVRIAANTWLDGEGGEQLELIGGKAGELFSKGLEAAAPKIAESVIIVGKTIAATLIAAFIEGLKASPLGAIIIGGLGGAAAGSVIPVVGTVAGFGIGAASGLVTWGINRTSEGPRAKETTATTYHIAGYNDYGQPIYEKNANGTDYWHGGWSWVGEKGPELLNIQRGAQIIPNHKLFTHPDSPLRSMAIPHATGGILTRPHLGLVAEAGPEAIIPLSPSKRSGALNLWQQTGRMLGVALHADGGIFGKLKSAGNAVKKFAGDKISAIGTTAKKAGGSIKTVFVTDKASAAGNTSESIAIGLESSRQGQKNAVKSIYKPYQKKIASITSSNIIEYEKVREIAHMAKNLNKRFGKATKIASRAAIPLSLLASVTEIIGLEDKKRAVVKELGSVLGAAGVGALAGAGTGALVGAGVLSPVTALLGSMIGAGVGAFGGQAVTNKLYDRVAFHAKGGIMTAPHLGLVAEAGPEAIIPLSSSKRSGALDLWQQTGQMLGVRPYASGGIVGTSSDSNIGINVAAKFANTSTDKWLKDEIQEPVRKIAERTSSWGRNLMNNFITGMDSSIGNLSVEVTKLTNLVEEQFRKGLGIASPSRMAFGIGRYVMQGLINGMNSVDVEMFTKKQMEGLVSSMGSVNGNVSGWLSTALAATNTPLSWLPGLQRLVQAESGGNPRVRNPQAVGTEHATGLLQTLPSTFRSYAVTGMGNILNPVHNAAAAINYIKSRYGSVYDTPLFKSGGQYVGYATGGILTRPHLGLVAEAGPEAVIPLSTRLRSRALELYKQTGMALGVKPYAEGGFTTALATSNGTISITVPTDISIQLTGTDIDEDELAYKIGIKIVKGIKRVLENSV